MMAMAERATMTTDPSSSVYGDFDFVDEEKKEDNFQVTTDDVESQIGSSNVGTADEKKDVIQPVNATAIPGVRNGWFEETDYLWPGQKFSLALEEFSTEQSILFHQQSEFQSILVFKSAQYGNVLVLDGVIQLTERDEFAYHEMMVHLPLCSHDKKDGLSVMIVGGGDGGALREVCRHDRVSKILVVEIDPMVVQVAKMFFGNTLATCFGDPRVEIVYADAAEYLRSEECKDAYDVIIGDTSDPIGPAISLFQPEFYEVMNDALRDKGIVCVQGECFWINLNLVSDLVACCDEIFDRVDYAWTMVPTYPCGQIGFIMAAKGRTRSFRIPSRQPDFLSDLKWYSPEMHRAALTLPPFVARVIQDNRSKREDENDEDDDDNNLVEEEYRCLFAQCTIL